MKTFVFDLGNVLVAFQFERAVRRLQARSRISGPEMASLIDQSPLLHRFETGQMTEQQFFSEVRERSGFDGGFAEFKELFADIFAPIDAMIQLHAQLRAEGFRTFIFSNTNSIALDFVRRHYPFIRGFDGYILSFEHGVMKPDAKLYEAVETVTGASGSELIYLDDRPENVAAGAARGWQAILHERADKTLDRLRSIEPSVRG